MRAIVGEISSYCETSWKNINTQVSDRKCVTLQIYTYWFTKLHTRSSIIFYYNYPEPLHEKFRLFFMSSKHDYEIRKQISTIDDTPFSNHSNTTSTKCYMLWIFTRNLCTKWHFHRKKTFLVPRRLGQFSVS